MIQWLREAQGSRLFLCFCSMILRCCIFLPMLVTVGCKTIVSVGFTVCIQSRKKGRRATAATSLLSDLFLFLIRKQNLSRTYPSRVPLMPSGLDPKLQGRLSKLHSGREKGIGNGCRIPS